MPTSWSIDDTLKELEINTCARIKNEITSLFINLNEIVTCLLQKAEIPRNTQCDFDNGETGLENCIGITKNKALCNTEMGGFDITNLFSNSKNSPGKHLIYNSQPSHLESDSDFSSILLVNPKIKIETLSENYFSETNVPETPNAVAKNSPFKK